MHNPTDIYILNVGAGSCVVIDHPSGRRSMIDINNGRELRAFERQALLAEGLSARLSALEAKLVNPIEWYRERFGDSVFRFLLSHPDADHMAGLRCLLQRDDIGIVNFWDLPHNRFHEDADEFQTAEAYLDWALYELMRRNRPYKDLVWPKVLEPERSDSLDYWQQDGIEILSPSHAEVAYWDTREDWNNMSFVLRVRYAGRTVMIPGDVEQPGWNAMAAACNDISADVLVASHHGRKSGYPDNGVMQLINPSAVVVSSDKLPREHDATDRYRNATGGNVCSTRSEGTLQIRIWADGRLDICRDSDKTVLLTLGSLPNWYRAA